jgi:hypothetical protein
MGEWRYSATILVLVTRLRWAVSFTPRPLYPRRKSPRYPLDRRLGGHQNRSRHCEEEKNLIPSGNRTSSRSAPSPENEFPLIVSFVWELMWHPKAKWPEGSKHFFDMIFVGNQDIRDRTADLVVIWHLFCPCLHGIKDMPEKWYHTLQGNDNGSQHVLFLQSVTHW